MQKMLKIALWLIFVLNGMSAFSQGVAISDDNSNPHPSAMLDVKSIVKGVLVPRLTTSQREAIASPANGLLVFDSTTESFWFFSSGSWIELINRLNSDWKQNGTDLYFNNGKVGIGTSTPSRQLHTYFNNGNLNTSPLLIEQAGSGDAFFNIGLTGSHHYNLGVDNSDNGKFKIGYNATSPWGIDLNTRLTITNTGQIGIGTSVPSARLQLDAITGEDAFQVRINGNTKFRIHNSGGISVGSNTIPPSNGLLVAGLLQPNGNITTPNSLLVETTGTGSQLQMKKNLNNVLIDETGLYGFAENNLIIQTGIGNNKIVMDNQGLSATTDNDIIILTTGNNKTVKIMAGSNEITIDESGGITINSGGNDLTIQTGNGDLNLDAGNGNINIAGNNLNFSADGDFYASSNSAMKLKSNFSTIDLESQNNLNILSNNNLNLESANTLKALSGTDFDMDATSSMTLNSPLIKLNNNGISAPAARAGSTVSVNVLTGFGNVLSGSSSVFIGP